MMTNDQLDRPGQPSAPRPQSGSLDRPLSRRAFAAGAALLGTACCGALLGCAGRTSQNQGGALGTDGAAGSADAAAPAPVASPASATSQPQLTEPSAVPGFASASPSSDVAVVYFSVPLYDVENRDADSGASIVATDDALLGNVEYVAQFVAALTGGDLLRIVPQTPYATDEAVFDDALAEQNAGARPAIDLVAADGTVCADLAGYQTVLVGYPIWWYELPMALYTFFENYDLADRQVAPFVVHGGSGFSGTVQDIETLQPDAAVLEGLSISRNVVADQAADAVASWLDGLGLLGSEG